MISRVARGLVLAALVAAPVVAQSLIVTRADFGLGDFRAFYCASRAALAGQDPYHAQPLHACERALGPRAFYDAHGDVTVPAPLPGYTLAFVAPFASLPFALAASLWTLLLAGCSLAAARATQRLAGWSLATALAAYALSLAAASLPYGEIVPIVVAALACGALLAREGRYAAAALVTSLAAIEPHVGVPAALALAIGVPPTRPYVAGAGACLALVSLAFVGPAANLEYLARVLPAHALAEATRDTQYSLTAVLAAAGMTQARAVLLGSISYALACASGIVLALLLTRRYADAACLPSVAAASVLLGGSFIHLTQMSVAIPAIAALLAHTRYRAAAGVALVVLAVPWGWATSPALGLAAAFPVAWMTWELSARNWRATAAAAMLAGITIVGMNALAARSAPHPSARAYAMPAIDATLAQASWARFTRVYSSANGLDSWIERIPTWFALALAGGVAWLSVLPQRAEAQTRPRPRDTERRQAAAPRGGSARVLR